MVQPFLREISFPQGDFVSEHGFTFCARSTPVHMETFVCFFHSLLVDTGRQVLDTFHGDLTDIDRCARSRRAAVNPPLRCIAWLGLA